MHIKRLLQFPAMVFTNLENSKIPFYRFILTFSAIIFIRIFLESFSQTMNMLNFPSYQVGYSTLHFYCAYVAIMLLVTITLSYASSLSINKVLRVMLPSMLILLICPILDIIRTGGYGANIYYMQPGTLSNWLKAYVTYGSVVAGVSLGQQIEIAIILFATFLYVISKDSGVLKAAFVTLLVYTLIFLWGSVLYLIKGVLEFFGFEYSYSPLLLLRFFLLVDFILISITAYLANPHIFKTMLHDIRGSRILYYQLSLLFGIAIAISTHNVNLNAYLHIRPEIVINTILTMISLFLAGVFSVIFNNIYDIAPDSINSPKRPLITGEIALQQYQYLGFIFMASALLYAFIVGSQILLMIGTMMGSYYLYSAPPIRFKRVPVLSKLFISLNSFAAIMLGYFIMMTGTDNFPPQIAWIYFIGITLAANFIDLKDVKGDKAAGIMTLPVLIGEKNAKRIIGTAFFLVMAAFYFVLPKSRLLPIVVLDGVLFYYVVTMANYKDWKVLMLCNISLFALILYLTVLI